MSKAFACTLSALLTVLCVVRGAYAQDLERLRFRADSLADEWREARTLLVLKDSLRRTSLPPTMEQYQAGALTVIADPSRLPFERATAAAWVLLDSLYGDAAGGVAGKPVVVRVLEPGARDTRPQTGLRVPRNIPLGDLTRVIVRAAQVPRGDPALAAWLGAPLLPGDDPRREREVIYIELVTSPAPIVRTCHAGDLKACADALGFVPSEQRIARWWTADGRRRVVTTHFAQYFLSRPATRALALACTEAGADSACTRLLEGVDPATLPRPFSPAASLSLARLALDFGGRGAYQRLLADAASPLPARLAAASGVPFDSLLSTWHARMLASRPERVAVPWWSLALAITWTGIFGLCATRSSRWRVA